MRSFKKIAAMIMAVAMLCSFTALADAVVELAAITAPDSDNPRVTLGYTSATNAAQTTMLVYKGEALAGADVVYLNQFAAGADPVVLGLGTEAEDYGTYTVVAGGMDVATTSTATFTYRMLAYDISVNATGAGTFGRITHDYTGTVDDAGTLKTVPKNTTVNFTFTPFVGCKITALTVDGEDKLTAVVADGGALAVTVTDADVAIAVTFEAVAADEEEGQAFMAEDIYDVPADVLGGEEGREPVESKLVFGKVVAPAGATITERGMYLEKKVGDNWEPAKTSKDVGPYFAAEDGKMMADGTFGIRFFAFEAGEYRVASYVKWDGGEEIGAAKEFVVE